MKTDFKIVGWHKDIYQLGGDIPKFIGVVAIDEPDREVFGYQGRQRERALMDIEVKRGRKTIIIAKGEEFISELIPLCGRIEEELSSGHYRAMEGAIELEFCNDDGDIEATEEEQRKFLSKEFTENQINQFFNIVNS